MTENDAIKELTSEIYCCSRCGTCKFIYRDYSDSCPSGKKFKFETFFASGKIHIARGLLEGKLEWSDRIKEIVFACPTCGNCTIQCQARHRAAIVDIIEALRADAVSKGFCPLPAQKGFSDLIEKEHNPYNEKHDDRLKWKEGINVPEKETAEILYFVGCTSSYRQQELAKNTVSVLNKLSVDYTVSNDEWCCGSPLMRTGQLDQVSTIVKNNLELIKKTGAKTIITSCAGCFRTLKIDYPKYADELEGVEILHVTEYLEKLLNEGLIKFNKKFNKKVCYHDPCHLGRHSEVYDAPRNIIKAIPGIEFLEMNRSRENSWCCGAGGGVKSAYKEWAVEISTERIEEAEEIGCEILLSACPFCKTNLQDAINAKNSNIKFMDIINLLNELL